MVATLSVIFILSKMLVIFESIIKLCGALNITYSLPFDVLASEISGSYLGSDSLENPSKMRECTLLPGLSWFLCLSFVS